MLTAEIIAVGSELLTPTKIDTNSLWLTERLNELGVELKLKTVVGDDPARLEETVRDALGRSDLVFVTGGLGPTDDDVTRQVAAAAVGLPLVYHQDLEDNLRERFRRWGREMPEINKRQAWVIDGAEVLPNPNGSAVGMYVDLGGTRLAVLPGPPRENQPMFNDFVLPKIREFSGAIVFRRRVLKVSGIGESALDEQIAPIYSAYEDVQTSVLFNKSEVEVHLRAAASTAEEGDRINAEIAGKIVEKLGIAVFSTEGEEMEQVVARILVDRGETVSVAESCTGGIVAQRLTDIPGSSAYFVGGVAAYANEMKTGMLGVPADLIERFGAVSREVAEAMAQGMRERADTTYAVSITGIAGPAGGTEDKPVGTVYVGFASGDCIRSLHLLLPGDRYLVRWRASQAALDYLRRQILKN
ncbi:MAG TPA: competence/damage-inducible protein A [Pyrinomonadaceae bacterium]|nr:competence/damage-inducible protein A [Pyrinomonadaceae bacterium]